MNVVPFSLPNDCSKLSLKRLHNIVDKSTLPDNLKEHLKAFNDKTELCVHLNALKNAYDKLVEKYSRYPTIFKYEESLLLRFTLTDIKRAFNKKGLVAVCPKNKIVNPKTNNCVSRKSTLGKQLEALETNDKILNPVTNRRVSKTGKIGKYFS